VTTPSPTWGGTRHVELRPLGPNDRDCLLAWLALSDAEAWLEDDSRRQGWVVEIGGQPAGLAGLFDIDRGHQRCAWVCHLAISDPGVEAYVHYWGLEYVFQGLKFAKLWSEAPAADHARLERLESYGFVAEARLRGHFVHDGVRTDVVRLGALASDWRAKRGAMAAMLGARGFDPPDLG